MTKILINEINHSVKAVIYSEGKILLQLRDKKPNIFYPGLWGLFGGSVENNEEPINGLKRELMEEIGLVVSSAKPCFTWNHYRYNSILHFFLVPLTIDFKKLTLNLRIL